jgi:Family of unknown function (DUF6064)
MKTANDFWNDIERYNIETIYIQGIFSLFLFGTLLFSFYSQNQVINHLIKILFSALFIFVGIYFFLIIDKSFTANIFGPYFIIIGFLFLLSLYNSTSQLQFPTRIQYLLYLLVLFYPIVSYFLNHKYPKQIFYISPCPITAIALITYCRLKKRNDILNIMLVFWGLTGIKAFIFDVHEDLILLIVGVYGLYDFIDYKRIEIDILNDKNSLADKN